MKIVRSLFKLTKPMHTCQHGCLTHNMLEGNIIFFAGFLTCFYFFLAHYHKFAIYVMIADNGDRYSENLVFRNFNLVFDN